MKRITCFFLFLFLIQISFGQKCKVQGNAGTYAGDVIKVYKYSDYITRTKLKVAEFNVDEEGYFSFSVDAEKPFEIFIDLDVFVGKIVVEPGKDFKIILPQKTVRSEQDILNPYFTPIEFIVRILNNDKCINMGMRKFNQMYDEAVKILFKDPRHINSGKVELEISKIKDATLFNADEFFEQYKAYRFLELREKTYYKNKEAVVRKNYSEKDILYENPAYHELLSESFGTFLFENKADSLIKYLFGASGWPILDDYLSTKELYKNKDFREYFITLNFFKLFYKEESYQPYIITFLQSALNTNINEYTRQTITNIIIKSGSLIKGSNVKEFTLYDQNKQQVSLSDYRGKFVYLCFFIKESYACQKELPLIEDLHKKNIEDLEVVTVFKDHSHQNVILTAKNNNYNWPLLHCYPSDKILKDYNIAAYPTYYLIHPKGTLLMLPAPGPADNFEEAFFKVYQEWKIEQTRKGK